MREIPLAETPPVPATAPRAGRVAAAILVPGVILAGSAGFAASDLIPATTSPGIAANYLPADGAARLTTGDAGVSVEESARAVGGAVLADIPPVAATAHYDRFADTLAATDFWRVTSTRVDAAEPQRMSVYAVTPSGIELLAATGTAVGFSYDPGLVVLPADVTSGAEWTQSGAALPDGAAEYAAHGRVLAVEGDCARVQIDISYSIEGDTALDGTTETRWCLGQGIVDSRTAGSGESGEIAVAATSSSLPSGSTAALLPQPPVDSSRSRSWVNAHDWAITRLTFRTVDPFYGDTDPGGVTEAQGVVTTSGTLALSAAEEVSGYLISGDTATRDWIAHPGGRILGVSAIGDVILVSTSRREVVAYSNTGVRLWSAQFPDLPLAAPTATGTGGVVLTTLDGTVSVRDLLSGEETWSTRLATEIESASVVTGDVVVVPSRTGRIDALNLVTGDPVWSASAGSAALLAATGDVVVALTEQAQVIGFDAVSGEERWVAGMFGVPVAVAGWGGVAITMSDEVTVAWDAATGAQLWVDLRTVGLAVGDGHALVTGTEDVAMLTLRDGETVSTWFLPELEPGNVVGIVPGADRFWAVTTFREAWQVGP